MRSACPSADAAPHQATTQPGTSVAPPVHAGEMVIDTTGPAPVRALTPTTPWRGTPRASLADLDDTELHARTQQATRRRTVAVEEPERSASGRLLMALLTEHARRTTTAPPQR